MSSTSSDVQALLAMKDMVLNGVQPINFVDDDENVTSNHDDIDNDGDYVDLTEDDNDDVDDEDDDDQEEMCTYEEYVPPFSMDNGCVPLFDQLHNMLKEDVFFADKVLMIVDPLILYLGYRSGERDAKRKVYDLAVSRGLSIHKKDRNDIVGRTEISRDGEVFKIINPVVDVVPKLRDCVKVLLMAPEDFQHIAITVNTEAGRRTAKTMTFIYNKMKSYSAYQARYREAENMRLQARVRKLEKRNDDLETNQKQNSNWIADVHKKEFVREVLRIIVLMPDVYKVVRRQMVGAKRFSRAILSAFPNSYIMQGVRNHPNARMNYRVLNDRLVCDKKIKYDKICGTDGVLRTCVRLQNNYTMRMLKTDLEKVNSVRMFENDPAQTFIDAYLLRPEGDDALVAATVP